MNEWNAENDENSKIVVEIFKISLKEYLKLPTSWSTVLEILTYESNSLEIKNLK
jgi:hypothetical protein